MKEALKEAKKAFDENEVPIGAVVVKDGSIIGKGHNKTIQLGDVTAHAEILAIREASKFLGNYRLNDCSLFVTLEPCAMCTGAMIWARIDSLYYGAKDEKAGAVDSIFDIAREQRLNHQIKVQGNIMETECSQILRDFFEKLRKRKKGISLDEN